MCTTGMVGRCSHLAQRLLSFLPPLVFLSVSVCRPGHVENMFRRGFLGIRDLIVLQVFVPLSASCGRAQGECVQLHSTPACILLARAAVGALLFLAFVLPFVALLPDGWTRRKRVPLHLTVHAIRFAGGRMDVAFEQFSVSASWVVVRSLARNEARSAAPLLW